MTESEPRSAPTASNRVIVVLGMHRSGTSALTGTLQQAGVGLGQVMTHSFDNIKGSRENKRIQVLHEDILNRAGGSWKKTDVDLKWYPVHKALRDSVIDSYTDQPVWGFKDPRTIFTINGWLKVLPQIECVATFRHPFLVAASLHKRNEMSYDVSLRLWIAYNHRLLKLFNNLGPFPLIEFQPDSREYRSALKATVDTLNLDSDRIDFIDPELSSSTLPDLAEEPAANSALDLYQRLVNKSRAEQSAAA